MPAAKDDEVEVRGMIPRHIADVLDAVSTARRKSRTDLLIEVLAAWAREEVHVSTVVQRVVGSNGRRAEDMRK